MAVTLRMCLPDLGRPQGRGFWSLRPHLLTEDNIAELQLRWRFWTRQRRHFRSWMDWWLEFAQTKITSFFRWKSKQAYDEYRFAHQHLYNQLKRAYDGYYQNPGMLATINRLKGELLALQRRFTHTFTRINEPILAGEPLSIFQLGDRRRKRTTTPLNESTQRMSNLQKDKGFFTHICEKLDQHKKCADPVLHKSA